VLDEFCRLFPIGDRRVSRVIQAQAQLIGHDLEYSEPGAVPPQGDRRQDTRVGGRTSPLPVMTPRSRAAAIDIAATLTASTLASLVFAAPFWTSVGIVAVLYYGSSTAVFGVTPGVRATNAIRRRLPALFAIPDRRRATA
jgi:hypothetical protein